MIGKNIALDHQVRKRHGKRMASLCQYLEQASRPAGARRPEVFFLNALDAQTGDVELRALAQVNPRARQPMRHLLHSWPAQEAPTPEQAKKVAEALLAECGLTGCLAKCALQYDTDNLHLHVVVCTVDPLSFRMRKTAFIEEALHRSCAVNEHRFGWRPQAGARYRVQPDGTLVRTETSLKPKGACAKSLHERAARLEQRTGQRSAQGVAQEVVATLLQAPRIDTWERFHRQLTQSGLRYRAVRGGAVIEVHLRSAPVVVVKASSVGRGATLRVLEQRFGPFRRDCGAIKPRTPAPTARIARSPEREALWQQYWREWEQHWAWRSTYEAFRARQRVAIQGLAVRHRAERRAVITSRGASGQGRGLPRVVLNALRRVLADDQARERIVLRVMQARERPLHWPTRIPGFDDWLAWRTGALPGNCLVGEGGRIVPQDLGDNVPFATADRTLDQGAERTDFIDYGGWISWRGDVDPKSAIAAVRLAVQKWPKGFEVRGDHAFIARVGAAAGGLGVADRITNPGLRPMIAEA
ncbi:relaxase/mobilization nuclease domain-containing protein, partial [Aromatoleum aromaticum]